MPVDAKPKPPTANEITVARKQVPEMEEWGHIKTMDDWKGQGWHKDEILLGILIGLQIAQNRITEAINDN